MSTNCIIWLISVLHFTWGWLLLFSENAYHSTPLFFLTEILGTKYIAGICLLGASTLSMSALTRRAKPSKLAFLLIPQQMFLIIAADGAVSAVLSGSYADGVIRSNLFILADQLPIIVMCLFHTIFFVRKFIVNNGNR